MTLIPINVRRGVIALATAMVLTSVSILSDKETWPGAEGITPLMWLFFVAAINGLYFPFLALIWKRRNWARWVVLMWCILGWVAFATSFSGTDTTAIEKTFQLSSIGFEIWGCQQLLSSSATTWFHSVAAK